MAYTGKINASNANITFRNIKKASDITNNSFNTPNISPGGGYGELAIDIGDALIKYGTIDDVTLTFSCHSNRGDCVVRAGYITSGNSGGYSWQKTVEGISRSSSSPTSFSHTFKPTRSSDGLYHLVIGTRNLNTILLATVNVYTITIAINYTPKQISYSFVNWDGSSLKTGTVDYGATPTAPENPSRASTAQYNYTFSGWSPSVGAITGNTTYTAQFTQTLRNYAVTFKDENGATLKTETVNYGSTVTAPSDPVKADTAQHKYTFDGWYDANGNKWYPNTAITSETVYTARFTSTVKRYTVTWKNYNGDVLETDTGDTSVPYGEKPQYNGATPIKPSDGYYHYSFAGWSPSTEEAIQGDKEFTAQFAQTDRWYVVKWMNPGVDEPLETDEVKFNTQPDYNGATPKHPLQDTDPAHNYDFIGWSAKVTDPAKLDTELETVKGDITYTAIYETTSKLYAITVILFDGPLLPNVCEYGAKIKIEAPEIVDFHRFVKWTDGNTDNPRTVEVTGEATYQAVYERLPVPIIVNEEQRVTGVYIVPATQTIVYVISGEVPAVVANGVTVDDWSFRVSNSVPDNSYPIEKLYINETRVY